MQNMRGHILADCKKYPQDCICGATFPRDEIPYHISHSCPETVISCPFKPLGCDWTSKRGEKEAHDAVHGGQHQQLLIERVMTQENLIKTLEQTAKAVEIKLEQTAKVVERCSVANVHWVIRDVEMKMVQVMDSTQPSIVTSCPFDVADACSSNHAMYLTAKFSRSGEGSSATIRCRLYLQKHAKPSGKRATIGLRGVSTNDDEVDVQGWSLTVRGQGESKVDKVKMFDILRCRLSPFRRAKSQPLHLGHFTIRR
jgi:TRAF-type zinc finger